MRSLALVALTGALVFIPVSAAHAVAGDETDFVGPVALSWYRGCDVGSCFAFTIGVGRSRSGVVFTRILQYAQSADLSESILGQAIYDHYVEWMDIRYRPLDGTADAQDFFGFGATSDPTGRVTRPFLPSLAIAGNVSMEWRGFYGDIDGDGVGDGPMSSNLATFDPYRTTVTPEPATLALLIPAVAGLMIVGRRKAS